MREPWLWRPARGGPYRLRLKSTLVADPGAGDETTTDGLARGVKERYLPKVRLFGRGEVMTHLGILHEASHPEPWIIAMDAAPTRAAVLDYGARWAIEPTFSDFKGRGFELEDSPLEHPERLERLILIIGLAMHWCVRVGRNDAGHCPTPLEKAQAQTDSGHWSIRTLYRSAVSWFKRGLRRPRRRLQNDLPLPAFHEAMRNQ